MTAICLLPECQNSLATEGESIYDNTSRKLNRKDYQDKTVANRRLYKASLRESALHGMGMTWAANTVKPMPVTLEPPAETL